MKATLTRDMTRLVDVQIGATKRKRLEKIPAGTVIDDPKAYWLVKRGVAEPADAECQLAANMNAAQISAAATSYNEVDHGIHPEDLPLFRAGKITGYRAEYDPQTEPPSMQYVRGPNWTDADTAALDGDEDDEDDAEEAHDQQAEA